MRGEFFGGVFSRVKAAQKPLHCKLIVHHLLGGGVERVLLQLAESMTALGHNAEIILLENMVGVDVPAHIKVTALGGKMRGGFFGRTGIGKWRRARALKKYLRGENADLVVASIPYTHEVCHLAKLPDIWYRSGIALCMLVGNLEALSKRRAARRVRRYRRIYNGASMITLAKEAEKDLARLGIAPKTVRMIENPFDFAAIRKRAAAFSPEETDYIVHVSRFEFQKRHDVLLHAYAESGVPQKLLLLGDAENPHGEKARRLVAELGIQERVIFKGFVRNPYPFIKNARALVLSSQYEGSPGVLVEALILGTPAVSTDCPTGPNEILTGELAAFLSPVGDTGALAENIKKALANPPKIAAHHIEKFDAEVSARKYLALARGN